MHPGILRTPLAGLLLASYCACHGKTEGALQRADAAPAPSIAVTPRDAGTSVDLLHAGPAIVFVSSNVNNPKDYPEHLVDGRQDTAWNSRTGDLVGATIAFSIPKSARITSLSLSAGFHKTSAKGEDLFAMNHRLRRVQIRSADGTVKTDWTFDPDKREPQVLPFAHPGGIYVLEVEEVVPGTEPKWKELALSELQVLGETTERYATPRLPEVVVATVGFEQPLPGTEDASYLGTYQEKLGAWSADACKTYESDVATGMAAMDAAYVPKKPWCKLGAQLTGDAGLSVAEVELEAPTTSSMRVLRLQTAKGTTLPQNGSICEQFHQGGCSDDMSRVHQQAGERQARRQRGRGRGEEGSSLHGRPTAARAGEDRAHVPLSARRVAGRVLPQRPRVLTGAIMARGAASPGSRRPRGETRARTRPASRTRRDWPPLRVGGLHEAGVGLRPRVAR